MKHAFNNIFENDRKLFTEVTDSFFTEEIISFGSKKYREWDVTRSKLAAAISKGAKGIIINNDSKILYLGAAHGYTISFLSRIADTAKIFAVEFAPRVGRELVIMAEHTNNVLPIVANANQPNSYYHLLNSVDIVYQDIAQRNQVEIFVKNCSLFLKKDGLALIAIKARSVDVTEKPSKIYAEAKKQLEEHFKIIDYRNLEPMQKDHAFFVCMKR